jgi:hypothetical protein
MPLSLPEADSIRWCAAGERNGIVGSKEVAGGGAPGTREDGDVDPSDDGHVAGW